MIPRCVVCGSREIATKYLSSRSGKFYCSKECMLIANSRRLLSVGFFLLFGTLVIGIYLLNLVISENELSLIIAPILIFGLGGSFSLWLLVNAIKGRKLTKERGLESEIVTYSCVFCNHEYDKRIFGAPTKCQNCGKESPFCDICYDYIFSGEPVYQIQNCGHIFHKAELSDYLENEEICPKCKQKVKSIDLEIK